MSAQAVWNAVRKGNAEALLAALDAHNGDTTLGRQADEHGRTLLHHAAVSRSLECVQLIATRLITGSEMRCHEGFTPLARACQRSAPLKIVLYLIKTGKSSINIGDIEDITPLHYAVQEDRLDLVETLVANGADANALDYREESPADIAAFNTGNISILIFLLFMAKSRCPDISEFCSRATYAVAKKIAIFKILYNLTNSQHMHRQRYDVSDILKPALLSSSSRSLIPFFIETEMKWEKSDIIRSLYERLATPDYDILAMLVWYEAKQLEAPGPAFYQFWYCDIHMVLEKLIQAAIVDDESLELMENLISFLKVTMPIVVPNVAHMFIDSISTMRILCDGNLTVHDCDRRIWVRFQRVVDLLMPCYGGNINTFVAARVREVPNTGMRLLKFLLPFIGYCSNLFMCRDTMYDSCRSDAMKILCRSIGTFEVQKFFFPIYPCFPLKRLARDVVRMAIYKAMGISKKAHIEFIQRLESFDLPKELTLYLKYSDSATVNGFLEDCDR